MENSYIHFTRLMIENEMREMVENGNIQLHSDSCCGSFSRHCNFQDFYKNNFIQYIDIQLENALAFRKLPKERFS